MASRRQTLGALSPGQVNSRMSMAGAGRVADKSQKGKRMTMMGGPVRTERNVPQGNAGRRQSSMYGPQSKAGQKADPRPVGSKQYMARCIRALITYLAQGSFDLSLSPDALQSPTGKLFQHIVYFIFRKIDPNVTLQGKIDEEFTMIYKRLCYPFMMSRSSLHAVGAPHTWPHLLAALVWLCELLVYEQRAAEAKKAGRRGQEDDDMNEVFFEYVTRSYQHFLAGDDALCAALDKELARRFEDRSKAMSTRTQELDAENARLRQQIADLRAKPTRLEEARRKRADFVGDVRKFEELIESLGEQCGREERRIENREKEVARREARLVELRGANAALEKTIATQEVSKEDQARMMKEGARLHAAMEAATDKRKEVEEAADSSETEAREAMEELQGRVGSYNAALHRLQMVPRDAKRANGADLEARLARDADPSSVLPLDVRGLVRPLVQREKERYAAKARGLGEELLQLQEKHGAVDERVVELRAENQGAEREVRRLEERHELLKGEIDAEMRFKQGQADRLKEEVESMKGRGSAALEESKVALAAAQAEWDESRRRCEREQASLSGQLSQAFSMLVAYKEHVETQLGALLGQMRRTVADVESLAMPGLAA